MSPSYDKTGAARGNQTPGLAPGDLDRLHRFRITDDLIELHELWRVTDRQAREDCGIQYSRSADLSGVDFPIWGADGEIKGHCVRRDNPEIEITNGQPKPKGKYLHSQDRSHLYFERTSRQWLSDTSVPVLFVEAYSSALATAAWCERTGRRYLIVATAGCWGWRGTIGKIENDRGVRVDEKGPSPDLDHIAWGRQAIILFDSNINSNDNVRIAARSFRLELQRREAIVRIARIKEEPNVNGPDDFLAHYDDDALAAVLDGAEEEEESRPRKSQADLLVELAHANRVEFFHQTADEPFVSVRIGNHMETYRVPGKGFRHFLSRAFWLKYKKVPSSQAIQDALNVLAGQAVHDGKQLRVHTRVADYKDRLYLDLADPDWQVVEITARGWRLIKEPPVKFIRSRSMLAIPEPVRGGNLDELREYINVADDDDNSLALDKAFLVQTLRPNHPFAILVVIGEQGSGKTKRTSILKSIVDPATAPMRGLPRDSRDLAIAATNGWVLAFDNVSHIPVWLSDDLCKLSTGGGFSTRELFTDDGEKIFDYQRPVILNGIGDIVTRPDLLDRSIIQQLPVIKDGKRREESELNRAFECARGRILGALLDAVVHALATHDSVSRKDLPRMADFATWAMAAEPAHSVERIFLRAYTDNRKGVNTLAIEASVVGPVVLQLMTTRTLWEGNFAETLEALNIIAPDAVKRSKFWPASARGLSSELRRIAPNLRAEGFRVEFPGHGSKGAKFQLERIGEQPSRPSRPSPPNGSNGLKWQERDGRDGRDGDSPHYSGPEFEL